MGNEEFMGNMLMEEGKIISLKEYKCEDVDVLTAEVKFDGERFIVTKNDGKFVYIHHNS